VLFPIQANGSLITKDGTLTTDDTQAVGSILIGQNFSAPGYFHPRPSAAGNGYDATYSGGSNLGPLSDKLINGATQTPAPATQPATTQPAAAATTAPAATQPAETLVLDGIRLRCIHFAMDNNIGFKLYTVNGDGARIAEIPLKQFLDSTGNLMDTALVDAFPHPESDPADKTPVIAADFATAIPGDAVTASGSGLDPHISPPNARLQIARVAAARHLEPGAVRTLVDQYTDRPTFGILGDPGVNVLRLNLALDKLAPLPAVGPAPTSSPAPPPAAAQ
jgi:K+-transporting ATPase ATPase C chain